MRRRIGLFLICGAVVSLAVASTAWACAALATLKLDKRVAAPGATVTGTGSGYNAVYNVTVRLDSRTGPVLWEGRTNPLTQKIEPSFKAPSSPGYYTILAVQNDATGKPVSGTPGRAPLEVRSSSSSNVPASPWSSSKPAGPGGFETALPSSGHAPDVPVMSTIAGVLLSLVLLASGIALVRPGRARMSDRPLSP